LQGFWISSGLCPPRKWASHRGSRSRLVNDWHRERLAPPSKCPCSHEGIIA
jgi:hypothetical protein